MMGSSTTAQVTVPAEYNMGAIALAAGNGDVEARLYDDGILFVEGVDQAALDLAANEYGQSSEVAERERLKTEALLVARFNAFLDSVAAQRRYDSRFTCALRAGFVGPFKEEGEVFAAWMDSCNMIAYQLMADVKAGRVAVPSEAAMIAMMPQIQWPPSPIPEGAV
jgi:hypothetical protein